jgi:hypothetical protein
MHTRIKTLIAGLVTVGCAGNRVASNPALANMPRSAQLSPTLDQARGSATLVDTIVVRTEHLELRRGQSLALAPVLGAEGRNSAGTPVLGFVPVFLLETSLGVAQFTWHGLQAIGPGSATIVVMPLVASRDHIVATRVSLVVR